MKYSQTIILLMIYLSCYSQEINWVKCFNGDNSKIRGITIGQEYKVITTGTYSGIVYFSDSISFNTTNISTKNIHITKFDSIGTVEWVYSTSSGYIGGNIDSYIIETDADQNIYISGCIYKNLYFDTILLSANMGNGQIFIAKLNKTGSLLWAKALGGPTNGAGIANIVITPSQRMFLCGSILNTTTFDNYTFYSTGACDFYISEFTLNGNCLNFFNDGNYYCGLKGCIIVGNSVFVDVPYATWASIGGDTVFSVGYSDYFIAEYSPLGTVQWIRNVTGISNNESKMEVMNGRIYLNGLFQDVIHFENDSLAASGTYGFYIAE